MTDRQIKIKATKKEYYSAFENMNPGKDIIANCSDGIWIREYWRSLNRFGWGKWIKTGY